MGRKCCVPKCGSKGPNLAAFYPSNNKGKTWSRAIGLSDDLTAQTAKRKFICFDHFIPEHINNYGDNKKILVRDAVPCIFPHQNDHRKNVAHDHNYFLGEGKIKQDSKPLPILELTEMPKDIMVSLDHLAEVKSISATEHSLYLEMKQLKRERHDELMVNHQLREHKHQLVDKIRDILRENNELKSAVRRLETQNLDLELERDRVRDVFREDQLRFIKRGHMKGKDQEWSRHTLDESVKIRLVCGFRGYELLKSLGWPLPSSSILNKRINELRLAQNIVDQWNSKVVEFDADDEMELQNGCGKS